MKFTYLSIALVLLCASPLIIGGCASVSVKNISQATNDVPLVKPTAIYVGDFTTNGEFNVDREGAELADFKKNLQTMLTTALVAEIPMYLVPSAKVDKIPAPGNYWLVVGQFIKVNQGSRALRMGIGFGAGGTKLETRVAVYNMASNAGPFMVFETTGGSNAEPGAVANIDPIGAALSAVASSARGLTDDTKRTARMITANLSHYMYMQGWVKEDKRLKPKMYSE